jgi:hypothetical protein
VKVFAGVCLVVGLPLLGAFLGAPTGERVFCDDDEYALLGCMEESVDGAEAGGLVGLLAVVALGIVLLTRRVIRLRRSTV